MKVKINAYSPNKHQLGETFTYDGYSFDEAQMTYSVFSSLLESLLIDGKVDKITVNLKSTTEEDIIDDYDKLTVYPNVK